jgi:hypothetical protein
VALAGLTRPPRLELLCQDIPRGRPHLEKGLCTVDKAKSDDHFERMVLHQTIERGREMIARYLKGMADYHEKIEKAQYALGELDERLRK